MQKKSNWELPFFLKSVKNEHEIVMKMAISRKLQEIFSDRRSEKTNLSVGIYLDGIYSCLSARIVATSVWTSKRSLLFFVYHKNKHLFRLPTKVGMTSRIPASFFWKWIRSNYELSNWKNNSKGTR